VTRSLYNLFDVRYIYANTLREETAVQNSEVSTKVSKVTNFILVPFGSINDPKKTHNEKHNPAAYSYIL